MSCIDYVFQGAPTTGTGSGAIVCPGSKQFPAIGLDTLLGVGYLSAGNGWVPQVPATISKADIASATANNANVLTYAVPSHMSGVYRISIYESSVNAPTAATLPAVTAVFFDQDTAVSTTATFASLGSVGAAGVINSGSLIVSALGGHNIVIATTSYAAGSGTALAYNAHIRIDYMG